MSDCSAHNDSPDCSDVGRDPMRIKTSLSLFSTEEGIVELRILGALKGTLSGYFDDIDKAALNAEAWNGRANVYATLNPVTRVVLSRAANRLETRPKHATADEDVVRRRYLFVDVDPVRPSGIAATDT